MEDQLKMVNNGNKITPKKQKTQKNEKETKQSKKIRISKYHSDGDEMHVLKIQKLVKIMKKTLIF